MITVSAHFGHWAVSLLYAAPVLILLAAVGVIGWRDRRRRRQTQADGEPGRPR